MVTGADPGAQAFSGRISLGLRRPSRDLIPRPPIPFWNTLTFKS